MKMDGVVGKCKGVKPTTRILLLVIILLLGFSGSGRQPAGARASGPTTDSANDTFAISISQPKDPICVGDEVKVTIQWGPNISRTPSGDGLAVLTPLAGPSIIKLKASQGIFLPDEFIPVSISGTKTVTYIADKEGKEDIFAVAWIGDDSDAIARAPFTIKLCTFWYKLYGELNLDVEVEDMAYSTRYTIESYGTLKAPDPDKPLYVEGKGKDVRLGAVFTSWSSKCVLFTWEPATGKGTVDARAYPSSDGKGMVLELAPPQNLAWELALSFACNGHGVTVANVYPITSKTDPWISATFPQGGGQQSIKLDMFEIPMNRLNGAPGISVSYTATVKLEKEPPK
jgi:hypothetical protein